MIHTAVEYSFTAIIFSSSYISDAKILHTPNNQTVCEGSDLVLNFSFDNEEYLNDAVWRKGETPIIVKVGGNTANVEKAFEHKYRIGQLLLLCRMMKEQFMSLYTVSTIVFIYLKLPDLLNIIIALYFSIINCVELIRHGHTLSVTYNNVLEGKYRMYMYIMK